MQDLTETAAELFLERGFESVAIDDLIARVGGSRRNIYSHFGGKEGLFVEVVTKLCTELAAPLEQLNIAELDVSNALFSFGSQLLQTVLQPRTLALHRLMVAEGKRFPELAQAIMNAGHLNAIAILTSWIESRRGKYPHGLETHLPAATLARQFVNMVVAEAQLRALVGLDPYPLPPADVDRIVNNAVAMFLHGASTQRNSHEYD
ncbi:TetR/AcrR family transcriptional regulator [Methylobacillus arboreus]|uniref:TetR/AcrR family transcriptional regulator n=1 Tax=Methylobacillus arboreus TaxID=755170 RepID=UPI001E451A61|nr:TetR/AcrR family transcriptional regulator [Methylobacillus arboreus]MCB5190432.1 TetR/AcrR family transcriptional regulator [Methylobacillus arboreus]